MPIVSTSYVTSVCLWAKTKVPLFPAEHLLFGTCGANIFLIAPYKLSPISQKGEQTKKNLSLLPNTTLLKKQHYESLYSKQT